MEEEQNNQNSNHDDVNPSELEELKAKLVECEGKRDEYLAGWQRAKADFVNYKKEEAVRMEDILKYGERGTVQELITILDNFDLAVATLEKQGPIDKGIYLIRSQFADFLKRKGIEKIGIKPGDTFDPNVAEAIAEVVSESPPGTIVEEVGAGYKFHDKVLRPVRVIVSRDKE